ncbi:MAG: DNA polymerase domain-containing protein [Gaiellaceae bacterium]
MEGRDVELTHLDRVFWPEAGLTKRDLLAFYAWIAPLLIPHVRDRPFTIKRHYTVPRGPFVWEKDAPPELPPWIPVSPQPAKSRRGALVRYPLVNEPAALLWMVEYGCIDLHVWPSHADRPDRPTYVLFDLDPSSVPFSDVVRAALLLRDALEAMRLEAVVRTTGGEGLHVHVPVERRYTHDETRRFAELVTGALVRASDGLITAERAVERRHGVYIDTKMNGHGQQIVSAYSVRPLPGAPVATPLRWDELTEDLEPRAFTMKAVRERVEREGDLAARLLHRGQRIDALLRGDWPT